MRFFLMLVASSLLAQMAAATPLSAIMNYESRVLTSEGVKKQTQFQERLIRDENQIWSQRIIPASAPHHLEEAHEGHEHNLNFSTSGKWLMRDKSGKIVYRLVRDEDKKIVEPRENEYGTLGFDGHWETAFYLVNRASLKNMKKLTKAAPQGTQWYETKDAEQFTRILWDEKRELPLSIETGKNDGTADNKITLTIAPTPTKLPWNQLAGYQTMAYEDLLD